MSSCAHMHKCRHTHVHLLRMSFQIAVPAHFVQELTNRSISAKETERQSMYLGQYFYAESPGYFQETLGSRSVKNLW